MAVTSFLGKTDKGEKKVRFLDKKLLKNFAAPKIITIFVYRKRETKRERETQKSWEFESTN